MDRREVKVARVVIASTRAATGVYDDRCGPIIRSWFIDRGFNVTDPAVVPDGAAVCDALRAAVGQGAHVIVTSGGTGISPSDATPEATLSVIDYQIPGLADAIRRAGLPAVPTAVLSRGVCGVVGQTLVINLPGSVGGVRDGLTVLSDVLEHALDQLSGGDHG